MKKALLIFIIISTSFNSFAMHTNKINSNKKKDQKTATLPISISLNSQKKFKLKQHAKSCPEQPSLVKQTKELHEQKINEELEKKQKEIADCQDLLEKKKRGQTQN